MATSAENRGILKGALWVTVFLFVAKIIGAAKEMAVAYRYGTSAIVDGYLLVFNMAQWLPNVFTNTFDLILIPLFVKLQANKPQQAINLRAALLSWSLVVGVVMSVLYYALMWALIHMKVIGLTAKSEAAALTALPWLAPTIPLMFMSALFSIWLMSQRRQANTFFDSMPSLSILVLLLFWPVASGNQLGALPLALATLLGFFLQMLFLQQNCNQGVTFANLGAVKGYLPEIRSTIAIVLFSQLLHASAGLIDQYTALRMGQGILASYSYAHRVMSLFLGLTGVVIARAALPVFSGMKDPRKSFYLAMRMAVLFAGVGALFILVVYFFSEELVMSLFQRGAFTSQNTRAVSQTLDILVLQMPFYVSGVIILLWLSANDKASRILIPVVSSIAAKVLGVYLFFDYGAPGVAGSTVLMYVANLISLFFVAKIQLKQITTSDRN